jgi:hypothetical protein
MPHVAHRNFAVPEVLTLAVGTSRSGSVDTFLLTRPD